MAIKRGYLLAIAVLLSVFFFENAYSNSENKKIDLLGSGLQSLTPVAETELQVFTPKKSNDHERLRLILKDVSPLLSQASYPQNFKVVMINTTEPDQPETIARLTATILSQSRTRNFKFNLPLKRVGSGEDQSFRIDFYNSSTNELLGSFKTVLNLEDLAIGQEASELPSSECSGLNFGQCSLEYFFDHVSFSIEPAKNLNAMVLQEEDGRYKVRLPAFRGRVSTRIRNIITNSVSQSAPVNDDTSPNFVEFFGIGTQSDDAFLNVRAGDGSKVALKINPGDLSESPVDGAFEYDGTNLYFTSQGDRVAINSVQSGPTGPQGPPGPSGAFASGSRGAVQFSFGGHSLGSDENDFFWDDTNKRLGIGTNTPLSLLSIDSTAGGALTNGITFGDGDSGIYEQFDDKAIFDFKEGANFPLNAARTVTISNTTASAGLVLGYSTNQGFVGSYDHYGLILNSRLDSAIYGADAFKFTQDIATPSGTNFMKLEDASKTIAVIDANGSLGLGTTVPVRKLHISDAIRIEPQSSPPTSPGLGDLYVDSDTSELCFYDGTSWTGIKAGGACN